MFIRFIEERSFVSDMDASLAFFDDCAEKVRPSLCLSRAPEIKMCLFTQVDASDECDAPLLELDDSQQSERTVFVMPPEPTGLPPGSTYSYRVNVTNLLIIIFVANQRLCFQGFVLNPLLFSQKEMKHFLGPGKESLGSAALPGSPVAKRTKHEIRSAQKLARKFSVSPMQWAKCLLGTCYR